jgi:hypothetical protein
MRVKPTAPSGRIKLSLPVPRRAEWQEQKRLAALLDRWLDPACTFATSTDPVAASALAGAIRKQRGVKPGVPDTFVLCRGRLVGIEMKSPGGKCSPSQRATREEMLRAGLHAWWECRSANAAMWALRKSGVKFRTLVNEDGTIERWQQPDLADWEVPRADPREKRPAHPEVRAARRRWHGARRAAREAARLAAERRYGSDFPTSARKDAELAGTPSCTPRRRPGPGDQLPSKSTFGP